MEKPPREGGWTSIVVARQPKAPQAIRAQESEGKQPAWLHVFSRHILLFGGRHQIGRVG